MSDPPTSDAMVDVLATNQHSGDPTAIDTSTSLMIWCLVLGETAPFRVSITRNQFVDDLKEAIHSKKKTLQFTDANLLTLYELNVPSDDNLPKIVEDMKLGSLRPLNPTHRLSKVFSAPLRDETVHILVQPPESVRDMVNTGRSSGGGASRSYFMDIDKGVGPNIGDKRSRGMLDNRPPKRQRVKPVTPSSANALNVETDLKSDFYWGRPKRMDVIPTTLLHAVFRDFVDDLSHYEPTKDDFRFAASLKARMMMTYETEAERCKNFRKVWTKYCSRLDAATITDCTTDGHLQENNFYLLITEGKREIDGSKADPLLQAGMYYLKALGEQRRNATDKFPCLIIYYFGSNIGFAGAIWSDIPQIAALTPIYTFHAESYDSDMALQVSRALGATKKALITLKTHYNIRATILAPPSPSESEFDSESDSEETKAKPTLDKDPDYIPPPSKLKDSLPPIAIDQHPHIPVPSRVSTGSDAPGPYSFPDVNQFVDMNGQTVKFSYNRRIFDNKLLFHVTDNYDRSLTIKFTTRYCEATHRYCAEHNIAPILYSVEKMKAGWWMVVMEYLDPDLYKNPEADTPDVKEDVTKALNILHGGGFVHGDLRNVNIFIQKSDDGSSKVKILDFDWAGKEGEAHYPTDINFRGIYRPPGVQLGGLMRQAHDRLMVDHIFK